MIEKVTSFSPRPDTIVRTRSKVYIRIFDRTMRKPNSKVYFSLDENRNLCCHRPISSGKLFKKKELTEMRCMIESSIRDLPNVIEELFSDVLLQPKL